MIRKGVWTRGSGKLALLLLVVAAPPAIALVWLGLKLIEQDRALVTQRAVERQQAAAQLAVHSLEQSLAAAERALAGDDVPDGAVRFTLSPTGMSARPANRVWWVPAPPSISEANAVVFTDAERLEFQGHTEAALRVYQTQSRSADRSVRAGALLRSARIYRNANRWDDAVAVYARLEAFGDVAINGMPADLVARRAKAMALDDSRQADKLSQAAGTLTKDFLAGRWLLDRSAWELTANDLVRWTSQAVHDEERSLLSSVAETLWSDWISRRERLAAKRSVVQVDRGFVTTLTRAQGSDTVVLAVPPALIRRWLEQAPADVLPGAGPLGLTTEAGQSIAGPAAAFAGGIRLTAAETGLPWTLTVGAGDAAWQDAELASRTQLLSFGLGAILLLFAGGSFFLWRIVRRELEIARLQADFVAAVSHEFRTPLTSLRHVTDLLEESDDMPRERRRSFYEALGRNADRLQRLVESLLDFARMESGRKPYDFRPVDVGELVTRVVSDFREAALRRGFQVRLDVNVPATLRSPSDAGSLTNALWNLLDNAVKYSPGGDSVEVVVRQRGEQLAIAVKDHGLGVPAGERTQIFDRFVRGRKASELGITGTGLGLAMVSHIAKAHCGHVELDSEEGAGSTFTIVLPLENAGFSLTSIPEARSLGPEA
jgi:signal transduction histidine kinase